MIQSIGESLLEQKDVSGAIVCFILAENTQQVLDIWRRRAVHFIQRKEATREVAIADLLQKCILLKLALESCGSKSNISLINHFNQVLVEMARYMSSEE